MSTPVNEICPKCDTPTLPIDKPIPIDDSEFGVLGVRMWRYICNCGWIWANDLQRKHNDKEYDRARKNRRYNF